MRQHEGFHAAIEMIFGSAQTEDTQTARELKRRQYDAQLRIANAFAMAYRLPEPERTERIERLCSSLECTAEIVEFSNGRAA